MEAPVTGVQIQKVGSRKARDIEVEISVVIDVREGSALLPGSHGPGHSRSISHVKKAQPAEVFEQSVLLRFAHQKNISESVVVVVTNRRAGADRPNRELQVSLSPH